MGVGSVVASTTNTVNNLGFPPVIDVTYTEWVYKETAGGTLDFIIEAKSNSDSTDILERITTGSLAGNGTVTTDVGFSNAVPFIGGTITGNSPYTADRSSNGSVVAFNFNTGTPDHTINAGVNSLYLIIKTNATQFVTGNVGFQNSVTASGPGFGVAPEPNMAALLSVLAVGILGIAYRRKKNVGKNTEA